MNVVFANHTSRISGAEHSLLELLQGLPSHVAPVVACPTGPLQRKAQDLGVPVFRLPPAELSLRLRPIGTPIGLSALAAGAVALRGICRHVRSDVVHANSIRTGLLAVASSKLLGGPPVVVHVRDCLPPTGTSRLTARTLVWGAAKLIFNSAYTARNFPAEMSPGLDEIVHNSVDLPRFDPSRISRQNARDRLGLRPDDPVIGVVAQMTPWKAQDDAVRTLAELMPSRPNARLILVGDATFAGRARRFDNERYESGLRSLAVALGVGDRVSFLGRRDDVPEILRALDVLLVPSWEEPFGRSVIEAMAMTVPVVATQYGGPTELITPGHDGLLLRPRRPAEWAAAVAFLLDRPGLRKAMGRRARAKAVATFGRIRHVEAVLSVYEQVGGRRLPETLPVLESSTLQGRSQ